MKIEWHEVNLPDFEVPEVTPEIPSRIYESRCQRAYKAAKCDWLVTYGDREHYANITYLTGFDPRFEEALFVLGPGDSRFLIVGNENLGYAGLAGLKLDPILCQSLSLMGQDRSKSPSILSILRELGIKPGDRVGVVGWKYLEPNEIEDGFEAIFAPAVLVDSLRMIARDPTLVVDETPILMHPIEGLRAVNEVEQIAAFEWAAARATAAVYRVVKGIRPGMTEFEAVAKMGFSGEPLSVHVMFASGKEAIIGLRSPTSRRLELGDGVTTAIGYWGGLGSRAGLLAQDEPDFLDKFAIPYYKAIATWYETAGLGVKGGEIFDKVSDVLAEGKLRSMLNPGHLTSFDEWVHTPIRSESTEEIKSGMAFQCDIIPVPLPPGIALNCEDPLVFADQKLRNQLKEHYPEVWGRIQKRQGFMKDELGVDIGAEILPMSTIPAYFAPLWLSPKRVLAVV